MGEFFNTVAYIGGLVVGLALLCCIFIFSILVIVNWKVEKVQQGLGEVIKPEQPREFYDDDI